MSAVDVAGLSYRYADGTRALENVALSVAEGERIGLIGPNGAGKSTILLHLNGLLPERLSADGAVRVLGMPVTEPNLTKIRSLVGFLFQDPDDQLFCATVFEDVAFGPRQAGVEGDALRDRVERALLAAGISGFERRPPHRLSRGEKHRVCLAGILACEPKVLVLDEPTSHLDPRGRRELLARLRALSVTQIVATHDLEFVVELCTRAILLDGGKVVAEGAPRELLSNEPLMLAHGLERPHILTHRHPHEHA